MHSLQAEQPETKEPILEIAKPLTRNWQFEGKQFYLDIRYTDTRSMSCKRCGFTIYLLHHHPPIIYGTLQPFLCDPGGLSIYWIFSAPFRALNYHQHSTRAEQNGTESINIEKSKTHRIASTSDKQRRSSGKRIAKAAESSRAQTEVPAEPKVSWSIDQVITKECCLARLYTLCSIGIQSQRNGKRKFITLLFTPITRRVKDTLYSFVLPCI